MNNKASVNKMNALKSTGPKTKEGKAIACQNSIRHGLLSQDLILKNESPQEFDFFRQEIYRSLNPIGSLEEVLVEKIVSAAWRFRRLIKVEKSLFEEEDEYSLSKPEFSDAFRRSGGNHMQVLSRYESTIEKAFYKAIHELQRIQAMRMGQPILTPIAIDINVDGIEKSGFV
ncbi:hypothetical protein [Parachlamydia sp.]|uniref:hypothetical protein n=1 Tax=Parachlamydia sp. TaxID=2052048 RepID=UPI003D0A2151